MHKYKTLVLSLLFPDHLIAMSEAAAAPEEGEASPNFPPFPAEELEGPPEGSRKRPRDADFSGDELWRDADNHLSSKRRSGSHDVLFRILVPSRQIGRVIGKEGSRIRRIREETHATIKIADAVSVSSIHMNFFGFTEFLNPNP